MKIVTKRFPSSSGDDMIRKKRSFQQKHSCKKQSLLTCYIKPGFLLNGTHLNYVPGVVYRIVANVDRKQGSASRGVALVDVQQSLL